MVFRYSPRWVTTSGGAGFSTFHFASMPTANGVADAVRAFFNAMAAQLPTDASITFPAEFTEHDTLTGDLVGVVPVTTVPTTVVGTSTGSYSAPTGGRVRWITNDIVRGRRVSGTTFIVPLQGTAYDTDGTLGSGTITALQGAATAFLADTDTVGFVIWSRPSAPGAADGSIHEVIGGSVPDKAAILRSRRD